MFAQGEFVGAVLAVAIVSTLGTAVVEAKISRKYRPIWDADTITAPNTGRG
jgi:hypothetical protein